MKKNAKMILAVISAACIALTACSKDTADTSASETAETATSETASAVEYDLGLDDDGYFRDVTASKYIKMPKDYKKYTVSKDVYVVTDEEIQSELDYFQSNYKLTTEVTDRAAQEGDVVNIDYEGTVDGVAFTGGTTEDYDLELGSNTFIDGFEEQIVGHNTGDSFDVTVTFPDGYSSTTDRTTGEQTIELANKEAVFHVTLNKISQYSMTDADVAGIMSGYKLQDGTAVTTVDLLREYVEENLRMNKIQNEIEQYFIDNVKLKKDTTDLVNLSLETNLKYVENEATAYNMDLETFVQTYSNSPNTQEIMFRLLVELAKQYKTVRFVLNINGKTTEVKYPVKGMMNSDILYGGGFSTCNITPRSEENRIEEFVANNDSQLEDNRRIPIKYIPEVYYGNKLIWKNPNFANT